MYRIAIVEDDESTNDTFRTLLEENLTGVEVDQFQDLSSAANAISSTPYDLVISDIDLGRQPAERYGGVRIAAMLQDKKTPVLIVSGLPQPDLHRDLLMALDAWDYLQKPVTESDFLNQTRRALQWRADRLRTDEPLGNSSSEAGDPNLRLDLLGRIPVSWRGRRVALSLTEIRIVSLLVVHANKIVEYEKLYSVLNSGQNKQNLRVHMQSIRNAFQEIDPAFKQITNVPMVGYSWRTS
jgi:DNA-binding response OmpR family regulator